MNTLHKLLQQSDEFIFSNETYQKSLIQKLSEFISKEKLNITDGFYPDYFAKKENISIDVAIKYLLIASECEIFKIFYEIKCPDCDYVLSTLSNNYLPDILTCDSMCAEETGIEQTKKIKSDNIFPFFKLVNLEL